MSSGEKDKDGDISVHSEGGRHTKMTDVIDAVEAATIAVVDMSFKVRIARLAGHSRWRYTPGSTQHLLFNSTIATDL